MEEIEVVNQEVMKTLGGKESYKYQGILESDSPRKQK